MSADTMPCGCEAHADREHLCRYPVLVERVRALEALARDAAAGGCEEPEGACGECLACNAARLAAEQWL